MQTVTGRAVCILEVADMENRNMNGTFGEGHKAYYTGKKVDADVFIASYRLWRSKQISMAKFCRNIGITRPTLEKHIKEAIELGYFPAYMFHQNQELWCDGRIHYTREEPEKELTIADRYGLGRSTNEQS